MRPRPEVGNDSAAHRGRDGRAVPVYPRHVRAKLFADDPAIRAALRLMRRIAPPTSCPNRDQVAPSSDHSPRTAKP